MQKTDTMKQAAEKYESEKVDRAFAHFPKGKKEGVQEFAARRGGVYQPGCRHANSGRE